MTGYKIFLKDVYKEYKNIPVVNHMNLSIEKGNIAGIYGPNGSGKSTLLRIIALVDKDFGGQLLFNDTDVSKNYKSIRNNIGYAPQETAMYEELTVRDNLRLFSILDKKSTREKIKELSKALEMTGFLKKKIHALSGGMKKRANLAIALVNNPGLLVADEPFAGLDSKQREKVIAYLLHLAGRGMTQVISSHIDESLEKISDKIIYMEEYEA